MTQDILSRGAPVRETTNLPFAAYCYMHSLEIVRAAKSRGGGQGNVEYEFAFRDPDERWDELTFAYANSESQRFDNAVRVLKQLCNRERAFGYVR